jgi:chemotaxis protein CheY-P-specific phosphatase CheC
MENLHLSREQLDVLKEIGTIGSGSAATALSQILKCRVSIEVPRVRLVSAGKIPESEFQISPDEVVIAVDLTILGEFQGGMLVLFPQKSALMMLDVLLKRPLGSTRLLNLVEASALGECSHILCSAYLNAVGQLLGLHQVIATISRTIGDRMDRLHKLLIEQAARGERESFLLPIENNLRIEGAPLNLFVVFLLHYESVRKFIKIAGM